MVVKRGHTIVKIYRTPTRGCEAYTVVHYLGKKRQRKAFADLDLARTEAECIANKLSTGELDVLTLTSDDRLSYVRAVEALKPTGVPLEIAAMQFAEAHNLLEGGSLLEAARFHLKQNPQRLAKKLVPEIVNELLLAKRADEMSAVYLKDLNSRLGRFAQQFKGSITFVTSGEIEDFLRGLKDTGKDQERKGKPLSGKSKNNYRRAIATLFYFAESRGYLPKGLSQVDSVAVAREDETDIEIFTPRELMAVMEQADPAMVPFLAIGAFAGLRHAEIQRLDWSEVRLDDGFIEVKASKAKTASRRLVPILDNLKRWLVPHRHVDGKVCKYSNVSKQLMWLAESVDARMKEHDPKAGFTWKHNAMRHSFISYRVAQVHDVAKVSLEAGNSPRMVLSNYRELVRLADAEKWFAVTPEAVEAVKAAREKSAAENVVAMPTEKAA
jgi:integrase